jgi:hypothetical protein
MIKTAIKTHISSDSNKVVSVQNSINFGYLMERKIFRLFPHGAVEKSKYYQEKLTWLGFMTYLSKGVRQQVKIEDNFSDYVVLDFKRPWFIVDHACNWNVDKCEDELVFEKLFIKFFEKTKERFIIIFEQDGFFILKLSNGNPSS